jgi:hypothetical protein
MYEERNVRLLAGGVNGLGVADRALIVPRRQVHHHAASLYQWDQGCRIAGVTEHGALAKPRQSSLTAPGSDNGHKGYVPEKFCTLNETRTDEASGTDDGDGLRHG